MEKDLQKFALELKQMVIEAAHDAGNQGVHIGGALSMTDIMAVLYGSLMRYDPQHPKDENRDRLILSKGHDALGLYVSLCASGYFTKEELKENYLTDGGFLPTHPVKNIEKGIECSTGSLGQGLAYGMGLAIAAKKQGRPSRIFVVMGDGECDEGSCWESFTSAVHYGLDNLLVYIDLNGMQSDGSTADIMPINLVGALSALGWNVFEADGHDVADLLEKSRKAMEEKHRPSVIVAKTIKGKGVSFMENDNSWHHGHMSEAQYLLAKKELEDGNQ